MIKFDKNIWFLFYIVCFLCIFNLALSYKISIVLQLSGLIALCLLPGYLFCLLFRIKVTDHLKNFLYSIGTSIIFIILFGLIINTLLPIFGESNPLSSQNLQIWFSVIILLLTSLILYTDNTPKIIFKIPELLKIEKIIFIFGFIILISILIGIFLVNGDITNIFLIFSIFLIPLLLIFLIIYHKDSIVRIYPFIIYLISFSLLMLLSIRSNYIIGVDSHEEYYIFHTTLLQSIWIPDSSLLLSAALSISILPTVFEKFMGIDPQLLFKLLFPLIFSLIPLTVYVIVKKYVNELLALFASCFFMFQTIFIGTTYLSRTALGIFFFAFSVLVIYDKELPNTKKYMLLLLFISGTIFSHYTTALIFFGLLFSVFLIDFVFSRFMNRRENRFINIPLIVFFISLIFFWYQQIINTVFSTGLGFLAFRMNIFNDLLKNDVSEYTPQPILYPSFLLKSIGYMRWLIYFFIGFGVLFAVYSWVRKEIRGNSSPNFSVNIDKTLIFMGIVSLGLLICTVFAPFIFFGYDTGRVLELISVVLSVFLIIGACNFFNLILCEENLHFSKMEFHKKITPLLNYCRFNKNKIVSGILLFLLIPQLVFATSIINQINGGPYSVILNSPKYSKNLDQLGFSYIFDQDAMALQWYRNNSFKNAQIVSDDYGNKKIISLTNQQSTLYQKSILGRNEEDILQGYIFLTVTNKYYNIFLNFHRDETKISSFEYILNQKNKIFANGAVLYI